MTIKTLEYIHKLLQDEERKTNEVYRAARDLEYEYRDKGVDRELIKRQQAAADEYQEIHCNAWNALDDFESQEW